MMYNHKRQRAPNFVPEEKTALLSLVYERRQIVENKKIDSITNKKKLLAWQAITRHFNAQNPGGVTRSMASLQKFYTNQKKEARRGILRALSACKKDALDSGFLNQSSRSNCPEDSICKAPGVPVKIENDEVNDGLKADTINNILQPGNHTSGLNIIATEPEIEQAAVTGAIPTTSVGTTTNNEAANVDWGHFEDNRFNRPILEKRRAILSKMTSSRLETHDILEKRNCELIEVQIAAHKRDVERKEEEFKLRKQLLELDIAIKKEKLRQLQLS